MAVLLDPKSYWACATCPAQTETREPVHVLYHRCQAFDGMELPLTRVSGPRAKPDSRHVVVYSEDYVGHNNPVTAVKTERGDGSNDLVVFPRPATGAVRALRR